jgi:hypothetical protein
VHDTERTFDVKVAGARPEDRQRPAWIDQRASLVDATIDGWIAREL